METIIFVLVTLIALYSSVSICFWYFLYQTINNLELLSKGNFKDIKIRQEIKEEIDQTKRDKSRSYLWPLFVYEILRFELLERKKGLK